MLTSNWAYMRGANLRSLTCMKREHVLWTLGSHWVGDLCVLFCSRAPRHASTFSWRTPGKVIRALVKHAFYWFSCVRDRDGSFQFARLFGKKPWGSVRQLVEYINLCRILVSQKKKDYMYNLKLWYWGTNFGDYPNLVFDHLQCTSTWKLFVQDRLGSGVRNHLIARSVSIYFFFKKFHEASLSATHQSVDHKRI